MKIRILEGGINHNGEILEKYEVYDLPDQVATILLGMKSADKVEEAKPAKPEPKPKAPRTPRFDAKKKGYVAEAVPERPLKPEEIDTTPVTGNTEADKSKDPAEKVEVLDSTTGKPIPEEKVQEELNKPNADAGAVAPKVPTVPEAMKSETVV